MMEDSQPKEPKFRVVGYLPDYRAAAYDPAAAKGLTDFICFAVAPTAAGSLGAERLSPALLALAERVKAEQGVRPQLCAGGWNRSKGFAALAATPTARRKFAAEAVAFCRKHGFAGLDVDWEHPQSAKERDDHGRLLGELKKAFAADKLRLTAAVAGWQDLSPAAIVAVDALHLMAYDADGRHSTFEFAQAEVEKLMAKGVPAGKIVLGVPFYGRHVTNHDRTMTYAEIVKAHRPAPGIDEVAGQYFNGPATIARKARFALERKLAGVMAWELGQDAPGADSLLAALRKTIDAAAGP